MTTIFHVFCFQDHAETKAQLEKVKKDLAETKKESHKRKKLLMAQQQLIHAGSGSYNKVQQEQLWKKNHIEIVFVQQIFVMQLNIIIPYTRHTRSCIGCNFSARSALKLSSIHRFSNRT